MRASSPVVQLLLGLLAGLTLAFVVLGNNGSASASWAESHCNENGQDQVDPISRGDARDYAFVAKDEGYEWGGGCWNDNNEDDTPNAPDSRGEGPDCSGFVFKSWYESGGDTSEFVHHQKLQEKHGPYTAGEFHDADGQPNYRINKDDARRMDAFASDSHIGMVYDTTDSNSDEIIEAFGDSEGTGVWDRNYRGQSAYKGVARRQWAPPD